MEQYACDHSAQVTSPIFQDLPRLPAPFGTLVHTAPYFTRLPLMDRLSATPLVRALLEHDADEEAYSKVGIGYMLVCILL